ncbi:MAG: cupin domain-containing protein [Actinomycetes bacterium]
MRITKTDIPIKIDIPGAIARQAINFGEASDYGALAAEYFSLGAGTDIAPLLKGLDDDACQAPHWGYMISGAVVISYTNGREETCVENDLFYWPPGHSVRVERDAEVILFSPQVEHAEVIQHMITTMAG